MVTQLSRVTQCRGCGKDIAFIKTAGGKTMPVNPDSVYFIPAGGPNTYVIADGTVQRGREPAWEDQGRETTIGYVSHFATCPAADSFRKKNKSERKRNG